MDTVTPRKGGRTARLDMRIDPHIKTKLETLARQADMSVADLVEWWTQQATATARIPHEVRIENEYGLWPVPVFRVRPNGVGNPRWPRRYSVIRYNGSDADHLMETDDLHEAVMVCEAAADAYLHKQERLGLSGHRKTYGSDAEGVRNARRGQDNGGGSQPDSIQPVDGGATRPRAKRPRDNSQEPPDWFEALAALNDETVTD